MTGRRYLAFIATDRAADAHWRPVYAAKAALLPGFATSASGEGFLLASEAQTLVVSDGRDTGAILGSLFRQSGEAGAVTLSAPEMGSILASRGAALIERFWGAYVAILPNSAGGTHVVRAPFGDLACYHMNVPGGVLVASDAALLLGCAGMAPEFDWATIAAHLIAPDIRRRTTCLAGIEELAGGDRLTAGKGLRVDTLWTPWSFVRRERPRVDASVAFSGLREAICHAVAARTAALDATVLLLSGGLDSSIVAASLAQAGRRCTAVTMVTRDAAGDEREHARATAGHLSIPLLEIVRDTSVIDIACSAAAGLPYPTERSFSQATMRAARSAAASTGATAIVHGGGGDNIFCAIQSAAPVADLILAGSRGAGLLRLIRNIATLAEVTNLAVLRQGLDRLWRRGPAYRWPAITTLLSPDGLSHLGTALDHPWLQPPRSALPGSAAHIALVLGAQSVVQSPDAAAGIPSIAPLLAQPIIETCLAIPSWLWFDRGRDRAAARHAFSPLLPEAVAWRRSKGAMDSFIVEIFEANRHRLKPFLLDGGLAASGLIDRDALALVLDDRTPTRGLDYARVMLFADVEAWLRAWRST